MPQTCYYTEKALPLDSEGRSHLQSTKALATTLKSILADETKIRQLIRTYNVLASSDPDKVMLAAYGLCGLRAVVIPGGGVAFHQPPGMTRKVLREKVRLANKLAERSLQLVHGVPASSTVGNERINRPY